MKRALFLIPVIVLVVLYLLLLDAQSDSNTLTLDENSVPTAAPSAPGQELGDDRDEASSPDSDTRPLTLEHPAVPGNTRTASVFRLADGDSFEIVWADTGELDEVRLFGINAPEAAACFGDAARGVLDVLTKDESLEIETIQRDDFGRVLANVWVGDLFVNATLVELGAALVLSDGGSHSQLIEQAQSAAQQTGAGLWDPIFCGADPNVQLRIAWIEADAPGQDNLNRNGEWIEIVNDGESAADMTDWSIRDESTRHRFFFPDGFVLNPAADVRVFSGCGDDTARELYWCDEDPVWNNRGDTGFLVDPDGKFADSRSYSG